jgi:hypothetical protein
MAVFVGTTSVNMLDLTFWTDLSRYSGSETGQKTTPMLDFFREGRVPGHIYYQKENYRGFHEYTVDETTLEATNLTGRLTSYSHRSHGEYDGDALTYYNFSYDISGFDIDINNFLTLPSSDVVKEIFSGDDDVAGVDKLFGLTGNAQRERIP